MKDTERKCKNCSQYQDGSCICKYPKLKNVTIGFPFIVNENYYCSSFQRNNFILPSHLQSYDRGYNARKSR